MSSDIRDILSRLAALEEGKTTPVSVKKGQNPQQKSVPQLPALFKPKHISVLGANKDPEHPMKGYAVGANESKLAEAMAEIEEDMLSKVKKDLNQYLDRLADKISDDGRRDKDTPVLDKLASKDKIDRELLVKAVNAVQKGQAEEDLDENDYELTEPETVHAVQDKVDTVAAQPQKPVQVMEIAPGKVFEVHQVGESEYEIRLGRHSLPSRFRSPGEADIALKLFKARHDRAQRDSDADYIEER